MTTPVLCIDCSRDLADAELDELMTTLRCECGLMYTATLVLERDVHEWERARTERLFRRDGDTLWMTSPLEAILDERP